MAHTFTFDVGTPCGGEEGHAPVTIQRVEQPAQSLTISLGFTTARTPLSVAEREQFAIMLIRYLVMQGSTGTNLAVRNALEATTINLTLSGF